MFDPAMDKDPNAYFRIFIDAATLKRYCGEHFKSQRAHFRIFIDAATLKLCG